MVEPTASRLLILVFPIMMLYGERHFVIANSISTVLLLPSLPIVTRRSITLGGAPEGIAALLILKYAPELLCQLAHTFLKLQVDQDAPSPNIEVAHMGNDRTLVLFNSEDTSNQIPHHSDVIHTIVPPDHQVSEHNSKWTKDHPLENIIGDLDRPVSTRLQIHEQALFYYYDAFSHQSNLRTTMTHYTQACGLKRNARGTS
ncbi:hypothetical protein Tco_0925774 [Tanacetum coccineum]|uniref:Uncharacterized protein n=1 Tax=Tanacetum coccineum TaxID=301880 RepID=A0ABQ5D7T3_9ASTR